MLTVLGIDVASKNWESNGSAQLSFDLGGDHFATSRAPALSWPGVALTPDALADAIDAQARRLGAVAVALDGPQGWRDPDTAPGTPGVGRRCEYECRTQAKAGVYPQTYPANQRRWVEFSIELFASLLCRSDVALASVDACGSPPNKGYVVLECFPTSIWRSAGLGPLPSKASRPDLRAFAEQLFATYRIPAITIESHDDLQAVVAAVAAAAYVGGPSVPLARGLPAAPRQSGERTVLTEGLIWDARPLDRHGATPIPAAPTGPEDDAPCVRVTQGVLDQVARTGRSQSQIALRKMPAGNVRQQVDVLVDCDGETYPLTIGDTHAAWVKHQTGPAAEGFDRLFAHLSDRPDSWHKVTWSLSQPPAHASPGDYLASQGARLPDWAARSVSIPVKVVEGQILALDGGCLPELTECIGDLVVPAFAVKNPQDLETLTKAEVRQLFDSETRLLCRVSGRHIPDALIERCRVEPVPDSAAPGAFVEIVLEEPLLLTTYGSKRATLNPVRCSIPALNGMTAESLNEAYRRVSERFEPKRRAVGGNVFRSVYYFDSYRDQWRPIGELRGDIVFEPR